MHIECYEPSDALSAITEKSDISGIKEQMLIRLGYDPAQYSIYCDVPLHEYDHDHVPEEGGIRKYKKGDRKWLLQHASVYQHSTGERVNPEIRTTFQELGIEISYAQALGFQVDYLRHRICQSLLRGRPVRAAHEEIQVAEDIGLLATAPEAVLSTLPFGEFRGAVERSCMDWRTGRPSQDLVSWYSVGQVPTNVDMSLPFLCPQPDYMRPKRK